MSSWSCPREIDGRCDKVGGALCVPGMKGCVLVGKVEFPDGRIPEPVWPRGSARPALERDPGAPGGAGSSSSMS